MDVAGFLLFGEEYERNQQVRRMQRNGNFYALLVFRKNLRDISNPFDLEAEYFRKFYRMPPALALDLVNLLNDTIVDRAYCPTIPVHLQVLAVIRFFAEGAYQKGVSQDFNHPISQPTFSRCLKGTLEALSVISKNWIKFPQSSEDRIAMSDRFLRYNRIAGILGLIDCFVVKMVRPAENEEAFFHHKYAQSMNVQVSDENYIVQSLRICPGSNTDRHIWKFSGIREHLVRLRENAELVNNEGKYYLLGDSGYTPSPILLTSIKNVEPNSMEWRYTQDRVHARCKVEQLFGLLSNVWLCISRRRSLTYHPHKVAQIITACVVLHNFRRLHGIADELPEPIYNADDICADYNPNRGENYQAGLQERDSLIQTYYNR